MLYQAIVVLALAALAVHSAPAPAASNSPFLPSCATGQYICTKSSGSSSFFPKCIKFNKICDGVKDCSQGDDEANELCDDKAKVAELQKELEAAQKENEAHHNQKPDGESTIENDFSGTGFMFSVENLVIEGGSNVKMFNQNSDNYGVEGAAVKKSG